MGAGQEGGDQMEGYCVRCRTKREMQDTKSLIVNIKPKKKRRPDEPTIIVISDRPRTKPLEPEPKGIRVNTRRAVEGICPVCKTKMLRFVKR